MNRIAWIAIGCAACGSSKATPDGNAACNELPAPARMIEEVFLDQMPPAPTGGPIEPGDYQLAAVTLYTGAGGTTGPSGRRIGAIARYEGRRYQYIQATEQNGSTTVDRFDGVLVLAGDTYSYTNDCPGGPINEGLLTLTPDGFILSAPSTDETISFTFVR